MKPQPPPIYLDHCDDLELLRGRLYATEGLLVSAREQIRRLELELEYEAYIANCDFWDDVAQLQERPGDASNVPGHGHRR